MTEMGSDSSLTVKESKVNVNRRNFRYSCELRVECETFVYQVVCNILRAILLQICNRGLLRHLGSPLALGFDSAARRWPRVCLGHFAKGKALILRLADFRAEGFGDTIGVGIDEFLFAAFDEEADLGFGAGVAEQDAAFAIE